MFKFGFHSDQFKIGLHQKTDDNSSTNLNWFPSEEISICDERLKNNIQTVDVDVINLRSEKLLCVKLSSILRTIKEEGTFISLAEQNHSDLIPSKYEGGLKVWECTHDMADYLEPSQVQGKSILDLGCGVGLLGILTLKLGAGVVYFQDYNADVLRFATIPNVRLNTDVQQSSTCRFFSGDWDSFAKLTDFKCDVLLTSETIYNPENYQKLHDTIHRVLHPTGTALVGAKSYYFGVGGSTRQFESLVRERDVFNVEVVWKCSEGVQREILKLTFKTKE